MPNLTNQLAVFRCDASPRMGGGHVIRCLTLGHALHQLNWQILFAVSPGTLITLPQLSQSGMAFVEVGSSPDAFKAAAPNGCDLAIFDHYEWAAEQHRPCRGWAKQILVIDDLANRAYDADFLLDQTLGRKPEDYQDLVPNACRILAGAHYALLRPEFAQLKEAAYARHSSSRPLKRILISMGMMDADNLTQRALDGLAQLEIPFEVDLVLTKNAPHFASISKFSKASALNIVVHDDGADMGQLMAVADLSIGASGVTALERCCLGLPSIVIVLADNQSQIAKNLHDTGASINLGWHETVSPDDIKKAIQSLLSDEPLYMHMVDKSTSLCDGTGTNRIISELRIA